VDAGLDLAELEITRPGEITAADAVKARYARIWSSGHGVGMVHESEPAAQLCDEIASQYEAAKARMRASVPQRAL